jgi:hypothetical protein
MRSYYVAQLPLFFLQPAFSSISVTLFFRERRQTIGRECENQWRTEMTPATPISYLSNPFPRLGNALCELSHAFGEATLLVESMSPWIKSLFGRLGLACNWTGWALEGRALRMWAEFKAEEAASRAKEAGKAELKTRIWDELRADRPYAALLIAWRG